MFAFFQDIDKRFLKASRKLYNLQNDWDTIFDFDDFPKFLQKSFTFKICHQKLKMVFKDKNRYKVFRNFLNNDNTGKI